MKSQKNILMLFLSTVMLDKDTGEPKRTIYSNIGTHDIATEMTNESALRYLQYRLQEKGEKIDMVFIWTSKATRQPINNFKEENCTHLDLFKRKITEIAPEVEIITQDYDEDAAISEIIKPILSVANKVKEYTKQLPADTKAVLHADITGGLRYANMLMMVVLRLMQYSGIKIDHVLYSNYKPHAKSRVEEADNVYRMFDLVSGAEEFVNFGSVEAITNYFENHSEQVTMSLQPVLKAMNKFSDELRLCHSNGFLKAIKDLRSELNVFRNSKNKYGQQEKLFAQLENRIDSDYKSILDVQATDIDIISWCLKHDYLQQALTLYVERVPKFLFDKNIVVFTEFGKNIVEAAHKNCNEGRTSLEYYFFCNFDPKYVYEKKADDVQDKNSGKFLPDVGLEDEWERKYKLYKELEEAGPDENLLDEKNKELSDKYKDTAAYLLQCLSAYNNKSNKVPQEMNEFLEGLKNKIEEDLRIFKQNYPNLYIKNEKKIIRVFKILGRWGCEPQRLKNNNIKKTGTDLELSVFEKMEKLVPESRKDDSFRMYGRTKIRVFLQTLKENTSLKWFKNNLSSCQQSYAEKILLYTKIGLVEINIADNEFRALMNKYSSFKNERNSCNHARHDEDVITADELKNEMQESLNELKDAMIHAAEKKQETLSASEE